MSKVIVNQEVTKVEIQEKNTSTVVENKVDKIITVETGPPGIKGDKGDPGEDANYIHVQDVPDEEWVIVHNLNKKASVTVVDSGENVCFGDVQYENDNRIIVTFIGAFSGKAYLN